jgi:nucleoside-diphosphate-sugar epimerase
VLADLAQRVAAGEPIDLAMGDFNCVWQGDANAMSIRALEHVASPPRVLNVTGPEAMSVRRVCQRLGERLGREPKFTGAESPTAYLNNAQLSHRLFGYPRVPVERLIDWTADWIKRGGPTLGKPTHFETRDGKF